MSKPFPSQMLWVFIAALLAACVQSAQAAEAAKEPAPASDTLMTGDVNVEAIKQKYWARGDESEMGVVQNRTYTKAKKFEFGLLGGIVSTDPFLNVTALGFTFGYHFSEYLSVNLLGFKDFVSSSTALKTLEDNLGTTAQTNLPYGYGGAEVKGSLIYGKLSLVGKAILYYDMHLLGGVGAMSTETGFYFSPHLGLGQQIYINRFISMRVDYRVFRYQETIKDKVVPTNLGNPVGSRANWSHSVSLGIDFMFGGGADK